MNLKTAIKKARMKKNPNGSDAMTSFMLDAAETKIEELFGEMMPALKDAAISVAKTEAATIKKGDKGEPGQSIRGDRGATGADGKPGKDGADGNDGIDGADGNDGKDGDSITGDKGKDGNEITRKAIVDKINEKPESISMKTIKGLENYLKNIARAARENGKGKMIHGGGMTLVAGTNVTLVRNNNGTYTVNGSAGAGFTALDPTETPDGSRTVFTFAAALAQPSYIIIDNVWMKAVTKAGTTNWTWNAGLKQATLISATPPIDDIEGVV